MSRQITKQLALQISEKLGAEKKQAPNHDRYEVINDGVVIAWFGIRRSSNKEIGHDHIPKLLFCSVHFCKELAICTKSREDWLRLIKNQGYV